ncbi:MAG: cyclopropane-fatty-acyl-phospholipid synthase family protein [Candidatus Binatia bacterium]
MIAAGDRAAVRARRLLTRAFAGAAAPLEFRLWDGSSVRAGAPGPARFTVVFRSAAAFGCLLRDPSTLGLGEAFIDGAIDLEGDLFAAIAAAHEIEAIRPRLARGGAWIARLARAIGRWRPRRQAREEIAFHYDVSNAFYALFLDPLMVYTCAYYAEPACDLAGAQEAKLDLVCRKLALAPGERLLDVGCGWGGLLVWAATRYRVEAHGVTLSAAQAEWARDAARRAGVADRVHVHLADYRDLPTDLRVDKIAAVGILEHQGIAAYPAYFARLHDHLRPGGLLLNQCITRDPTQPRTSAMDFLDRHVFPGGDLANGGHVADVAEHAGLELLDVASLRAHYVRTTRDWLARLEANATHAQTLVGTRTYRAWRAYLAGAAVAFDAGWINLYQILLAR